MLKRGLQAKLGLSAGVMVCMLAPSWSWASEAHSALPYHQQMVTTSPLFDEDSSLVINYSSMNEDLAILKVRRQLEDQKTGVFMSGSVSMDAAFYESNDSNNDSDINLSGAEFNIMAFVNPWSSLVIDYDYDDSDRELSAEVVGDRVGNSNVYLSKAFGVVGDLNRTPFSVAMGQMYAPFGRYTSEMWSSSITKTLGRIEGRIVKANYYKNDQLLSVFAMRGDVADSENAQDEINNFGIGAYREAHVQDYAVHYGAGWVYDIGDSSAFMNYYEDNNLDFIVDHVVDGGNAFVYVDRDQYRLSTEYVSALQSFDASDISYQGHGAKPSAFHSEFDIGLPYFNKTAEVGFAYDRSWESQQINLPRSSYMVVYNADFTQNTSASIEYRYNDLYTSGQSLAKQQIVVSYNFYF